MADQIELGVHRLCSSSQWGNFSYSLWLRILTLLHICGLFIKASSLETGETEAQFDVEFQVQTSWPRVPLLSEAIEFIADVHDSDVLPALRLISSELGHSQFEAFPEDGRSQIERLSHEGELRLLESLNSTFFKSPFTGPLMSLSVFNRYFSARVEFLRTFERRLRQISSSPCQNDTYAALCIPSGSSFQAQFLCDIDSLRLAIPNIRSNVNPQISSEKDFHPCSIMHFDHFLQNKQQSPNSKSDSLSLFVTSNVPHIVLFSSLSSPSTFLKEFLDLTMDTQIVIPIIFRFSDSPDCRLAAPNTLPKSNFTSSNVRNLPLTAEELCWMKPSCCGDALGGYGAELAVKNSEYKTVDSESIPTSKDSLIKPQSGTGGDTEVDDEPVDLEGIVDIVGGDFDRLLEEKELELLGLQAASEVASYRNTDDPQSCHKQLEAWYRLASNFPAYATRLAAITVSPVVISAAKKLHSRVFERASVMTLNGGLIESGGRQPSFFGILQTIGPQIVGIELLAREGLSIELATVLMQAVVPTKERIAPDLPKRNSLNLGSLPTRLDWRIEPASDDDDTSHGIPLIPIFDVLTHPSTREWPENIDKMMILMMSRGMVHVKAPLYHVLILFDPLDLIQLSSALSYLKIEAPMQLYFLPVATSCFIRETLSSQTWDENLYGPKPSIFVDSPTTISSTLNPPVDQQFCYLRERISNLYFSLLLSKENPTAGQTRAINFWKQLEKLISESDKKESLPHITEDQIIEIFLNQGGKKSSASVQGSCEYSKLLNHYVNQKGLVSNMVVLNGRSIELKSLEETTEITTGPHTQRLQLLDLFKFHIAQEQQLILTGLLYDAFSLPDDSTPFVLSLGSVPTCLFPQKMFFRSHDEYLGESTDPSLCEVLSWNADRPTSSRAQSPLRIMQWSRIKDAYHTGTFAVESSRMPLLTPQSFQTVPSIELIQFSGCWPISTFVAISPTVDGLIIIEEILHHFENHIQKHTPLRRAFSTLPFCLSLRLGLRPSSDQHPVIVEIVSVITAILNLPNISNGSPLTTIDALKISTRILQASLQILVVDSSNSQRVITIFNSLPLQIITQHLKSNYKNVSADTLWKEINTLRTTAFLTNELLTIVDDFVSNDSLTIAVVAINGQFIGISHNMIQSSYVSPTLQLFEMIANSQNIETLVWPTYSKKHTGMNDAILDQSDDDRESNESDHNFYELIFNRFKNHDLLNFALDVRNRVLQKSEVWSLPKKLFEETKSILRLQLSPPQPSIPTPLSIYGILDPLSGQAQGFIPIFEVLNKALNIEVNLIMNPAMTLKEYPLMRWYRQVIYFPEVLSLTPNDLTILHQAPVASFTNLNTKHVLTAGLHVPETWLVRARTTNYDLDNLRPSAAFHRRQLLSATFELSDIFIEGQALPASQPQGLSHLAFATDNIAGLQLSLHSSCTRDGRYRDQAINMTINDQSISDTLVMGNLAYFQLRARPGLFWIRIDRHTQLPASQFAISSYDDFDYLHTHAIPVSVNSLVNTPHHLRVIRLSDDSATSPARNQFHKPRHSSSGWNIWGSVKSIVTRGRSRSSSKLSNCTGTVHVFSLASGHMYERLLRIMILSVRKHTECPLEFWFIDNFLSPKFKLIMPSMAERYNLKYHFVTYKWPSWLRKQTEKQRQIWAYKILFLDVLFPNHVPKVIYIDADQVVRANIQELWDMDLHGNVYAFTPFCDSNLETEGYRFWKQGYWKTHLDGKPYHISALFVVDLKQFRAVGAGDSLRSVYMALSRDKDSLANLDQDLPNFAQHEISIYPLPQEWLWCETWCTNKTLATAKTIDLCNNPMTKEPKLSQARRILPEWETYDEEIRELEQEVLSRSISLHDHTTFQSHSRSLTPEPVSLQNITPSHDEL